MKRRSYSREFKVQAVKMITEQGLSIREVSRDLGVSETVIRNWKRKLAEVRELRSGGSFRQVESHTVKRRRSVPG